MRPPVVLGYHGIADVSARDDPVRLFVSPERLRHQIERLLARGYELVAMAEFARRLAGGESLRATCALTFDDGTEDHARVLPEVLGSLGVPGTVYVCPGLLGESYPWASRDAGIRFMTRAELEGVARNPLIEIGAHTNQHVELHEASAEEAFAEMDSCKRTLETLLDHEVPSFCYPRCHYSPAAPAAAERAGYTSAVTCGPRGSWDRFQLKRESMHTPDGPLTFALKSRGLYYGVRDLPPARLARWATRRYRHRAEREDGPDEMGDSV
jgi:peptidoglycan/xylan/chitin deacetylase (PgdA/CDA1 family)